MWVKRYPTRAELPRLAVPSLLDYPPPFPRVSLGRQKIFKNSGGGGVGWGARAVIQHFDLLAKQSEIHKIRHKKLV